MTTLNLYQIILKTIGIWLVYSFYTNITNTFFSIINFHDFITSFYQAGLYLFLSLIPIYLFIFQTDLIIRKLKLNKGIEVDSTSLDPNKTETIYHWALILISTYLLFNYLPVLVTELMYAFKNSMESKQLSIQYFELPPHKTDYYKIILATINVILGYLTLTNVKIIAQKIEKLSK
jgi:hypothetical protein